ncbi:MAG: SRPBCC domain-containing protein [Anaerolineales bacterium]
MSELSIHLEIHVEAPLGDVWRFLGSAEGLARWFADAEHITMEPWVGGAYEERGRHGDRQYRLIGQVTRYQPPNRLAFTLRLMEPSASRWPLATLVTIELLSSPGGTTVLLDHTGFERLPPELQRPARDAFAGGWPAELAHLQQAVADANLDSGHRTQP